MRRRAKPGARRSLLPYVRHRIYFTEIHCRQRDWSTTGEAWAQSYISIIRVLKIRNPSLKNPFQNS